MNAKGPMLLCWGIFILGTAAGLVLLAEAVFPGHQKQRSEEFQRLVGGLGMGPALDLSRCPFCFDPRINPFCQEDLGPFPGGTFFCPHHACSIFYYPKLTSHTPED